MSVNSSNISQRKLLATLSLCSFFVGLDSLLVVPLLPAIASSASISWDRAVLLVTAYALAYMLTAPLFGAVSDRWGRKRLILPGIATLSAGTILTGFGTDLSSLLAFRALTGIGAGMIEPSVFALVGDRFDYNQRGRAMGLVIGAMVASTLFGVPLGSFLAEVSDWHATFWVVGILALGLMLPVYWGVPRDQKPSPSTKNTLANMYKGLSNSFTSTPILVSLAATFLWYAGLQGMFANAGIFYSRNFELGSAQIGLVIMVAGLGSVLGSVIGGHFADRIGKQPVFTVACLATAIGVLVLSSITSDLSTAVAAHVIWATSFGVGQSTLSALISELTPDARCATLSLNSGVMFGGMMMATAISSAILDLGNFLSVGIMCSIAALLVLPLSNSLFAFHTTQGTLLRTECSEH